MTEKFVLVSRCVKDPESMKVVPLTQPPLNSRGITPDAGCLVHGVSPRDINKYRRLCSSESVIISLNDNNFSSLEALTEGARQQAVAAFTNTETALQRHD